MMLKRWTVLAPSRHHIEIQGRTLRDAGENLGFFFSNSLMVLEDPCSSLKKSLWQCSSLLWWREVAASTTCPCQMFSDLSQEQLAYPFGVCKGTIAVTSSV